MESKYTLNHISFFAINLLDMIPNAIWLMDQGYKVTGNIIFETNLFKFKMYGTVAGIGTPS